MMMIDKTMIIGDILNEAPDMARVLMGAGMHCVGCPSSAAETVEEAAIVHGFVPDEFVATVNDYVKKLEMVAKAAEEQK